MVRDWQSQQLRVALVPTMGSLHEGHLALVREAGRVADKVVVSIFVNPAQFNDPKDYDHYPRDIATDADLLQANGCDLLFLPSGEEIYPAGYSTYINVDGLSDRLEGAFRPGHFRGVATVVTRLLLIASPEVAIFGEKDAQQLAIIRRLTTDLELGVEILGHPTVREDNGLAMSSRNALLSPAERQAAAVFHRALTRAAELIAKGSTDADSVRAVMKQVVGQEPFATLEYAEVVDPGSFSPVREISGPVLLPIAGIIGSTRLIDNILVESPKA